MEEFVSEINAIRALEDGLSPYDPTVHDDYNLVDRLVHQVSPLQDPFRQDQPEFSLQTWTAPIQWTDERLR